MDCHRWQTIYYSVQGPLDHHCFAHFASQSKSSAGSSCGPGPWLARALVIQFCSYQLCFQRSTYDPVSDLHTNWLHRIYRQIHKPAAGLRFHDKWRHDGSPCPSVRRCTSPTLPAVSSGWPGSPA